MGLFYIYPTNESDDQVRLEKGSIEVRTFGMPFTFWLYWLMFNLVLIMLYLLTKNGLYQMLKGSDSLNFYLALVSYFIMISLSLVSTFFLFLELRLKKEQGNLLISHAFLGLVFYRKSIQLSDQAQFTIELFQPSPNLARIDKSNTNRSVQNRGYFNLKVKNKKNEFITIDRSNRKDDLIKLMHLLERF